MKYCNQCHGTYPTDFTTCPKDQSVLVAAAELREGMVLRGKYEVLEKIGTGGMATVYRVRHLHLREDVAIKVVSGNLAGDPDFLERFQTEAVVTRKLRHPNAVRLDDFDMTDDGRPFIVMELVRGQSLRSVLQNGWLAPARAAAIARQVALALGAAHELAIVHRDIKPENILLIQQADGTELVKVLDFGIARVTNPAADIASGHTPTRTGIILGTPQYVSPEQAKGVKGCAIDGRSDLYSLGVVLYEMLTGDLPFHADTAFDLLLQHVQTIPKPPHLANDHAGISPAMSELVMKALEKDPAKRFQTAAEFVQALSDPAVSVKVECDAGPHVFSTAALAAAAAAASAPEPAKPATMAVPAASKPGSTVLVTGDATLPMGSAVRQDPATVLLTTDPTLPMRSTSRAVTMAASSVIPAGPKPRSRRWYALAAACVALALGGWGISAFRGHASAQPDATTVQAAPAQTAPVSAPVPVARTTRTPRKPAPRPTAEPSVSNSERARELTTAGYNRLAQRDYQRAQDDFQQALQLDPGNASAKRGLELSQGGAAVDTISSILHR